MNAWRCEAINLIHCRRGRGQPKMSWNEVTRGDLKLMGLMEDMGIWHRIENFGELGLGHVVK